MNFYGALVAIWGVFSAIVCTGIIVMKDYDILEILYVPFFLTVILLYTRRD